MRDRAYVLDGLSAPRQARLALKRAFVSYLKERRVLLLRSERF